MKRILSIITGTTMVTAFFLSGLAVAGEKVSLCHYPPGAPENWRMIVVSKNAADAHLAHGDLAPMAFYEDADGDGFGNDQVRIETCKMPVGFVDDNTDCDDFDANINPSIGEVQGDGLDNDCNPDTQDASFKFSGILTDVPKSEMLGWSVCYQGTYDLGMDIEKIQSNCTKANIMLACGEVGSTDYKAVAHAAREDVFFDTGMGNTPHNANGVNWYFSKNYSMGFAPEGTYIFRYICDLADDSKEERLCWHTNRWIGGWSCGGSRWLDSDATWERIILQAD